MTYIKTILTEPLNDLPPFDPRSALESLRKHVKEERDFNQNWIILHLRDGHPGAAERRREIVAERDTWLGALDVVLKGLKTAYAATSNSLSHGPIYEKP